MTTTAAEQMRAAQLQGFGGPDVLHVETVAIPAVGSGDVLVRVGACAINHHDTFVRDGTLKLMTGRKFPLGLGLDFAGEVLATGHDVRDMTTGSQVWGMVSPKKGHRTGAAAQ